MGNFLISIFGPPPPPINFVLGSHMQYMDMIGHGAAAPGPLASPSRGVRPLACPIRSARPKKYLNLT